MWLQAITTIGGWVHETVANRQQIKKAKTLAEIERINNWEQLQAQASMTSWKDEWFTVLLSIPFAMCFIPELAQYAHVGFEQLTKTPEWYRWMFGMAVSASFGIRMTDKFKSA